MQEIIAISEQQIGKESINAVNSRDIYKMLNVKTEYAKWIQRAVDKYDFQDGVDFVIVKNGENGNRPKEDYITSLDMAKELCMVSNTTKGKEVRKYFIEVEKQSKTPTHQLPQNYIEALEALLDSEKEKQQLAETIKKKDEVILAVADLNIKAGDVSIGDFAKNLAIKGLGRNNMYTYLKGRGYLMQNNAPYQQYVERGYFKRKPYEESYGGEIKYKTVLTPRGTVWLTNIIRADFELDEVQ